MLPRVRASTVSWMKVSTSSEETTQKETGGPARCRAARSVPPRRLADELVRAVRLDLEDVELRVQRVVRLRREAERATEDPVRDHDLLDLANDCTPVGQLTLACDARLLDRGERDLRRQVRRRTERAQLRLRVVLLPTGDERLVSSDAA